jgi:uncharacterized membrane protein
MEESSGGFAGFVTTFAEWSAAALEMISCALIVALAFSALVHAAAQLLRGRSGAEIFRDTRRTLVRSILMGLEFLVAADIVHTVAVDLTFTSVGVLAIVVAVRTFLSFVLELEMTGRWPWEKGHETRASPA